MWILIATINCLNFNFSRSLRDVSFCEPFFLLYVEIGKFICKKKWTTSAPQFNYNVIAFYSKERVAVSITQKVNVRRAILMSSTETNFFKLKFFISSGSCLCTNLMQFYYRFDAINMHVERVKGTSCQDIAI